MVRLLLHSADSKLEKLLSVTLGCEYAVTVEAGAEKVKKLVGAGLTDVLILDFDSNQSSLAELLELLRAVKDTPVPIVVMTDDDRRSTAMELLQHGVTDYFRKPPHLVELRLVIRRAHEQAQLKAELARTRDKLRTLSGCDQMIGSSDRMRAVYDLIRRVANLNTYVLIQGESGTGKELVARAIHNLSDRARAPFVAVCCGAIPDTLIEAELFGHEKGAFTGAAGARVGYLEQALDGTLFLDEIGELSLHTQVKLLRVLQEKQFCRLGSSRPISLKARVLFATHRHLGQMVEEGKFRQDLYFRVNVLKIPLPPLRDRPEDIPDLAHHFLKLHASACGRRVNDIRPSAMQRLVDYDWPGNVRELENVIQRAVILAEDPEVSVESLPEDLQMTVPRKGPGRCVLSSYEDQLRGYKAKLAYDTLEQCNGNKSEAARRLNITRVYLHRLLRQGKEEVAARC